MEYKSTQSRELFNICLMASIPVRITTRNPFGSRQRMRNNCIAFRKNLRRRNLNNLLLLNHNVQSVHFTPQNEKSSLPSFFLSNTRSLVNKIEDLEVVLNQNHVDIACITETWLTNNIPNSVVNISDYTLVRKDRNLDKR